MIPNFDVGAGLRQRDLPAGDLHRGVFYDADNAPPFLRDIAQVLPLTHLIDGLSGAMVSGRSLGDNLSGLCVICIWTLVGLFFAIRGFSWESRRDQ